MRPFRLLVLLPLCVACQPTPSAVNTSPYAAQPASDAVAAPQTQGEQEVRWAQEFFQKHYRYQEQPKYTGHLSVVQQQNALLIIYNHIDTLRIFDTDPVYYGLFTRGIICLEQPESPFYQVCNIKPHLTPTGSPQRRRFTLWHFGRRELNPEVYLFELTNTRATAATDQQTFVEGAVLSFTKRGWGVL